MKTVGFSAGEVIFREGDAALAMYVIQKGSVGVWLDYDTEEKQQLSVLKEQQLLGEMGLRLRWRTGRSWRKSARKSSMNSSRSSRSTCWRCCAS